MEPIRLQQIRELCGEGDRLISVSVGKELVVAYDALAARVRALTEQREQLLTESHKDFWSTEDHLAKLKAQLARADAVVEALEADELASRAVLSYLQRHYTDGYYVESDLVVLLIGAEKKRNAALAAYREGQG
jgi:uncharacterized protein (DUF885 family)